MLGAFAIETVAKSPAKHSIQTRSLQFKKPCGRIDKNVLFYVPSNTSAARGASSCRGGSACYDAPKRGIEIVVPHRLRAQLSRWEFKVLESSANHFALDRNYVPSLECLRGMAHAKLKVRRKIAGDADWMQFLTLYLLYDATFVRLRLPLRLLYDYYYDYYICCRTTITTTYGNIAYCRQYNCWIFTTASVVVWLLPTHILQITIFYSHRILRMTQTDWYVHAYLKHGLLAVFAERHWGHPPMPCAADSDLDGVSWSVRLAPNVPLVYRGGNNRIVAFCLAEPHGPTEHMFPTVVFSLLSSLAFTTLQALLIFGDKGPL